MSRIRQEYFGDTSPVAESLDTILSSHENLCEDQTQACGDCRKLKSALQRLIHQEADRLARERIPAKKPDNTTDDHIDGCELNILDDYTMLPDTSPVVQGGDTGGEDYISCINCNEPLFYEQLESETFIDIELPYCPNNKCPRYGLYTAVA